MATVTTKGQGVTFVLELSEAEAQYVQASLIDSVPARLDGGNTVYIALTEAMESAGVPCDYPDALRK